jgi:tight adherence protein B
MTTIVIYIIGGGIGVLLVLLALYFLMTDDNQTVNEESLKNLIQSQRKTSYQQKDSTKAQRGKASLLAANQGEATKKQEDVTSPGLGRRLYFAQWSITALQYRILQLSVTAIVVGGIYPFLKLPLVLLTLGMTPLLIESILERSIRSRFNRFDKDYPDFLMAFISRLKSGMNSLTALQSAASGFSESSLIRIEIELMLERIRLGIQEEQAISAFGETIAHPEIDLFVQGLILSRRVGGSFAQTIERLSKQVRKRQEFRKKAVGAVAMERGSGVMIAFVMIGTMVAIYFSAPDIIMGSFTSDLGQMIFQGGASVSIVGFYVQKKITEIKV